MFEKILVCLDGSHLSEQIMPYIMEEAHCFGKVILLRVLSTPEATLPLGVPGVPGAPFHTEPMLQAFEKEVAEAPAYLERLAQLLCEKGLEVECVILQGMASEAIVNYARANGVKLIALATHGHGGLRRTLFGSTAESILRNSGLPVLVMRPRE